MNNEGVDIITVSQQFLFRNYDYTFLKTMLEKGASMQFPGATLITGSSHALNGIYEPAWDHAVNCSMHSQDIYYDRLCAKKVLEGAPGKFSRCFIVMGYYIAFQDLSSSKVSREGIISNIYYPIFKDAHNWDDPKENDPWAGFPGLLADEKEAVWKTASKMLLAFGSYYSRMMGRGTYFDLKGKNGRKFPPKNGKLWANSAPKATTSFLSTSKVWKKIRKY
ncbi:MAG: hypothetical protein IJC39_00525 [Firmicutes bacterium]|nr:hypothetical protein [Bacillota bacterium]